MTTRNARGDSDYEGPLEDCERSLPGLTGRDIVSEISGRRESSVHRARRMRCFGTNSCDCRRCR